MKILFCVLVLHFKKDAERLEKIQKWMKKQIKGLESKLNKERLKELGIFNLKKRRLRRDITAIYKYLKACHKEDEEALLSLAPEDKTWGNRLKLQQKRLKSDLRKNFLIERVLGQWKFEISFIGGFQDSYLVSEIKIILHLCMSWASWPFQYMILL